MGWVLTPPPRMLMNPATPDDLIYKAGIGANAFPSIFDRLAKNATTNARLTGQITPSTGLNDFLRSDALAFDGPEATSAWGSNPKLYAPTTFKDGSSVGHLDETVFRGMNNSPLMSPFRDPGERIHNPGPVGIGIMKDLGWVDALLYTSNGDAVTIKKGGFITPNQDPETILNIGSTYNYQVSFYDDAPPFNSIVKQWWKLEVRHTNGVYVLHSTDPNLNTLNWQVVVNNLPSSGYEWVRNINGQVRGTLTVYTELDDGDDIGDEVPIVINYKPDQPVVTLKNNPNGGRFARWGCSRVKVSFYAKGATSYNVHYKQSTDLWWTSVIVPLGMSSYTFTGLDESKDYLFQVEAINSAGGTASNSVTRKACTATFLPASQIPFLNQPIGFVNGIVSIPLITAFPNPCIFSVQFNISSTVGARIQRIELINTSNSAFSKTVNANPPVQQVLVDMSTLPAGLYSAKVTDTNNYEVTLLVLKIF